MALSPTSVLDAVLRGESESSIFDDDSAPSLELALQLTLAGKLLSSKKPSVANMTLFASRIWGCSHRMSCFDHGKCLFSFEFTHAPDVDTVLKGGPWFINGDLLLINKMNQDQSIDQLPFNDTKLWARCYDLPPKCFNVNAAMAIGNGLGGFCETDLPSTDPGVANLNMRRIPVVRKYLRVKFIHNLSKPLKRTQIIAVRHPLSKAVEEIKSRLSYERLPLMCYRCGIIGHIFYECPSAGPLLYGEWIHSEHFFRYHSEASNISAAPANRQVSRSPKGKAINLATKVNTTSELMADPAIINANYNSARALGPLPTVVSRGKSPMIEIPENFETSVVPFAESSNVARRIPVGEGAENNSILGPIPIFNTKPPPHPNVSFVNDFSASDNEENSLISYFNPSIPHEDLFSPTVHRCLFKSDLVHPAFSTNVRGVETSPKLASPVNPSTSPTNYNEGHANPTSPAVIGTSKEEKKKAPASSRKRPVGPSSPRPKRGRSASNVVNLG